VSGLKSADVQFNANGRSEGFAILKFDNKQNASSFKEEYDGVSLDGRPLKIEFLDGKPVQLETRRVVTVDKSSKAKVFEGKSGRQENRKRGGSAKPKKTREPKQAKSLEDLDKELDEYKNE
jgi:THO complex subunit 4